MPPWIWNKVKYTQYTVYIKEDNKSFLRQEKYLPTSRPNIININKLLIVFFILLYIINYISLYLFFEIISVHPAPLFCWHESRFVYNTGVYHLQDWLIFSASLTLILNFVSAFSVLCMHCFKNQLDAEKYSTWLFQHYVMKRLFYESYLLIKWNVVL
jgi:hypothetical protein